MLIYGWKNKTNNKWYIGQTKHDTLEERSYSTGYGYKNCKKFYRAIKKYGWENFDGFILEKVEPENADEKEAFYISFYDSMKNGYNSTSGGQNGFRISDETKNMISIKKSEVSNETRKKLSKAISGIVRSTETKEKISNSQKKKIICIETKEVFDSAKDAGLKIGISSCSIRACIYGKQPTAAGYHWEYTEDNTIRKNKKQNLFNNKRIICFETGVIFSSLSEAAKSNNLYNVSHISEAAKNQNKTAAGYHWKYM